MIWVIRYWQPIAAAILTAFIAFGFHSCLMDRADKAKDKAVETQKLATQAECIKLQEITTNASKSYQDGLSSLERDLSGLPVNSCVTVHEGESSSRSDATYRPDKPRTGNEVHSGTLYEFSKRCEIDRLKVIGLQKFIIDERK